LALASKPLSLLAQRFSASGFLFLAKDSPLPEICQQPATSRQWPEMLLLMKQFLVN
jgi:hypothetical protein